MNRRSGALVLVALALLATSCASAPTPAPAPWCEEHGVLMLAAQSVPEAQLIPCVALLPLGWTVGAAVANERGTTFPLHSSIAGSDAAVVRLSSGCDIEGLVQVPSDEAGTERFEHITRIQGGFRGSRSYVFDGGCVTIDFTLDADVSAALLNDVSLALSFVPRSHLNDAVRSATDGREQLDPPPDSG